jgi:hypothetical protein
MGKVVITLTTVPERLSYEVENGFKDVISSLCEQNYDNYEVHLNLPDIYKVTGESYVLPTWMDDHLIKYPHLKIYRVEDVGPPTKVVPTIQRESPETLLVVVDDDLIYHPDMISEHIKYHEQLPNSVMLYDGRNSIGDLYGDLRDSWVICVTKPTRIRGMLQHYKSVSYYQKYFDNEFFQDFLGKTKSDDILMTYYFLKKKIKMYVIPYENDIDKLQTYDEWYKFQGVTTFPVLRHTNGLANTGCNHPITLETEIKFFIPDEFKKID